MMRSLQSYAVIETYCDNWAETGDYEELLRFEAPAEPDQSRGASGADHEEWCRRYRAPALRRTPRTRNASFPLAVIAVGGWGPKARDAHIAELAARHPRADMQRSAHGAGRLSVQFHCGSECVGDYDLPWRS